MRSGTSILGALIETIWAKSPKDEAKKKGEGLTNQVKQLSMHWGSDTSNKMRVGRQWAGRLRSWSAWMIVRHTALRLVDERIKKRAEGNDVVEGDKLDDDDGGGGRRQWETRNIDG